ncbi:hypothetical protein G5V59_03605 [Nocardioides sp. W3-2-3]|nr:hypothetical protein [Nocardioides convexus]
MVSEGADVTRSLRVRCGEGARLLLREVLVLGRFGEAPGRLRQTTTVIDDESRPVLVEDLPLGPGSTALLLGGHRVLSSVLALGAEPAGRRRPRPLRPRHARRRPVAPPGPPRARGRVSPPCGARSPASGEVPQWTRAICCSTRNSRPSATAR